MWQDRNLAHEHLIWLHWHWYKITRCLPVQQWTLLWGYPWHPSMWNLLMLCVFAVSVYTLYRLTCPGVKSPDLECKGSLTASFFNLPLKTVQSENPYMEYNKCNVMKENTDVKNIYLPNLKFYSQLCGIAILEFVGLSVWLVHIYNIWKTFQYTVLSMDIIPTLDL